MEQKANDKQIGGNHYKRFKIQPSKFIYDNVIKFNEGNIIKYVCRHEFKNGLQDLEKAGHYVDLLLEFSEGTFINEKAKDMNYLAVKAYAYRYFCKENQLSELQSAMVLRAGLFSETNNNEYLVEMQHIIKKLIEKHYGQ